VRWWPVSGVQGNGKLCDSLTQLFICVCDSDQDRVFRFRDKGKVNECSWWEQGDWGLFDAVLWPKFFLT
jgi:hypothetical protein